MSSEALKAFGRRIKRIGLSLMTFPFDRAMQSPTAREIELCDELRSMLRAPLLPSGANSPASGQQWIINAERLRQHVLTGDPREFLRWDVIQETMFVSTGRFLWHELQYLRSRPDWDGRWRSAIQESKFGRPTPYVIYPRSSGTLIQHAYHLAKFEETTGTSIEDLRFIFEFGGGYGSMCRLCHRLGFSGRYLMFDLQHFSALQRFFLKSIGMPVLAPGAFRASDSGVCCVADPSSLEEILSTDLILERSLFVATWSLSEVPVAARNQVLPLVTPFTAFLIAYQHLFHEVNNLDFFGKWAEELEGAVTWSRQNIEYLAGGNSYLMGKRRGRPDA